MLFADDIVYIQHFSFKTKNNKKIDEASENARVLAQAYLNKLESWMNMWQLALAPHKCAQITFSKASTLNDDDLEISLYGNKIPYEKNPKFLGIVFDARLNFEAHHEALKAKINDRINILKVLSFDKQWHLEPKFLVNIYRR